MITRLIKNLFKRLGSTSTHIDQPTTQNNHYNHDGLTSIHNCEFIHDPQFKQAYARGMQAAQGVDYKWYWRVHVGIWAASVASKLSGDYVECGVGNGFLSSTIMAYLDWNSMDKHFYLFDTFDGIDLRYVEKDKEMYYQNINEKMKASGIYAESFSSVQENFSEWKSVHLVQGAIPETLNAVKIECVSFLHIDMNNPFPETAAFEYFYEKLTTGGLVLLDDYAYCGHREQKVALDYCAKERNNQILSLPTGQGLLIKA